MRLVVAFFAMLFTSQVFAENRIDVISKYDLTNGQGQMVHDYLNLLNKLQNRFEYRLVSIIGGEGEAAYQRLLQTRNAILHSNQSTFTEVKDNDRYKKFLFLNTISESISAFAVNSSETSTTIDDFVSVLRKKENIFFGTIITASTSKLLNEEFEKKYNLRTQRIAYKNANDLLRALIGREVDYAILNPSGGRSGDIKLLLSAGNKRLAGFDNVPTGIEIGFTEFQYSAYSLFSVPADNKQLYDQIRASFIEACKSTEFAAIMQKRGRILTCMEDKQIVEMIQRELVFLSQ